MRCESNALSLPLPFHSDCCAWDWMSFALDEHGVYHGVLDCSIWRPDQTFVCECCERTVCYCGGHDSDDNCNLCDECCTVDHFGGDA